LIIFLRPAQATVSVEGFDMAKGLPLCVQAGILSAALYDFTRHAHQLHHLPAAWRRL